MKKKLSLLLVSFLMTFTTLSHAVVIEAGATYEGGYNVDFTVGIDDTYTWTDGLNAPVNYTILNLVINGIDYTSGLPAGSSGALFLYESTSDTGTVFGDSAFDTWFVDIYDDGLGNTLLTSANDLILYSPDGSQFIFNMTQSYMNVYDANGNLIGRPVDPTVPPAAGVPEPAALGLLSLGLVGLGFARRRRAA